MSVEICVECHKLGWTTIQPIYRLDDKSLCRPHYEASKRDKPAKDRKDKIEQTLVQAQKLDGLEAIQAWRRLCRELEHMTQPEARMPRFNGLLHAVWIAASNDQT